MTPLRTLTRTTTLHTIPLTRPATRGRQSEFLSVLWCSRDVLESWRVLALPRGLLSHLSGIILLDGSVGELRHPSLCFGLAVGGGVVLFRVVGGGLGAGADAHGETARV